MQKNKSSLFTILFFSAVVTQTITISADFSQEIPLQGIPKVLDSFTTEEPKKKEDSKEPFEAIGEGLKLSLEKTEKNVKKDKKEEQSKKEINREEDWIAKLMQDDLNWNSPLGMAFSAAILGTAVGGVYLVGGFESIPQIAQGIVAARDHFNAASPSLQTLYTVSIFGLMYEINPEFTSKILTILGDAKPVYKLFKNMEKEKKENIEKEQKAKSKKKEEKRKEKEEKEKEKDFKNLTASIAELKSSVVSSSVFSSGDNSFARDDFSPHSSPISSSSIFSSSSDSLHNEKGKDEEEGQVSGMGVRKV